MKLQRVKQTVRQEGACAKERMNACEKRPTKIEPHGEQVMRFVGQAGKRVHSHKLHELRSY